MTIEQTTPPTYTCTCSRDGTVQEIQGEASEAYKAGWSKLNVQVLTEAQKTQPMPVMPFSAPIDLCPTCTQGFLDFMRATGTAYP